jgi:hypothetical protein
MPELVPASDWMSDPLSSVSGREKRLLGRRIRSIAVDLKKSPVERVIKKVFAELKTLGLGFYRPKFFIGDGWAYHDGACLISVPFWMMRDDLFAVERKVMLRDFGSMRYPRDRRDDRVTAKIVRHEIGHAFSDRFELTWTKEYRKLFGHTEKPYNPVSYYADLASPDFPRNFEDGYGESHPDEDFAESFAVWADPDSNWREVYRDKPKALAKLLYIDRAVCAARQNPRTARRGDEQKMIAHYTGAAGDDRTVSEYYDDKIARLRLSLRKKDLLKKDRKRSRLYP